MPDSTWKGFDLAVLRAFGIRHVENGIEVPYFTRRQKHWRSKLFRDDGRSYWLGDSKPQIPYGLETLNLGGDAVVLTEGESDALALRLAFPKLSVLGIPGASSWKTEWTVCLDDFCAIYLSFDGDDAGESLTQSVLASVPFAIPIQLPRGADTRDLLQRLGKKAYGALVEQARAHRHFNDAWGKSQAVHEAWRAAA